jgi:D-alanyl-D-alanine carboxypeptidase
LLCAVQRTTAIALARALRALRGGGAIPLRPLLALALVACGSSSPAADTSPSAPDLGQDALLSDRGPASPDRAPDARSAACLAQDGKLQAALDGARKSPNAILVVRNAACGTSVYLSGDPANATAASLWRIGSVTKTYVAATVLALTAAGQLSLDDPLAKWIPAVPQTDGVTLRMLLNHTSGIFNVTEDPNWIADPKRVWTPAEIVALATKHDPYFAPGAGWHYSNTNYTLLGMILEKVGGAKASAVLRKHALGPAGLTHTFLEGEEVLAGKVATGFDAKKNDITNAYSLSGPWTAGAMVATGADLCDWVATLYGSDTILDAARRKLMTENGVAMSPGFKYGLGVMLLDATVTAGAGPGLGHNGGIFGSHTQAFYFPDKATAICAVVNQDGVDPNDVTLAALLALFK